MKPNLTNRMRVAASVLGCTGLFTFNKVTIPENSAELEELLNDDARRDEVFGDAESTKEFLASYQKAVNKGENISKQVSEQVSATIADMLKDTVNDRPDQTQIEELVARMTAQPVSGAEANAAYNPLAPGAKMDGVVNSIGEFAQLLRFGPKNEKQSEAYQKIKDVQNAYSSSDPASAGTLIPEEQRAQILQTSLEQSIVRPRSTVITMTSLTQKIPYVDAKSHASSVFGGMVFYWTEEAGAIIATEAKFGKVELSSKKLTGGARVPNELWNDAPALSSWMNAAIPSGLAYYEDLAFLSGSGVGEPLGVFNADARVAAGRTNAGGVVPSDIYGMYARMLPQSLGNAVWVANQELLPDLLSLSHVVKNVAGTENVGGSNISLVQGSIAGGFPLSILGRPLIISEKASARNAEADLSFIDFRHYLLGDRQSISIDASEHSRFMNDETELRVIERVDGRPWLQNAITPKNGTDTLSPFVVLEAS